MGLLIPLTGFTPEQHCFEGAERTVWRRGSGPAVVIMHEVPGITPPVARFAARVAQDGFSVWMPELFGITGAPLGPRRAGREILGACVQHEFHVLAMGRSSPITTWLRALCRHAHTVTGGRGVGALGMCLTGNFALALMVDEAVMAPVLSQPSLPFPITPAHRAALHLSPAELAVVKERAAQGVGVLGLRFTGDLLCPGARFQTLRRELGDGFEGIEIDSGPGNAAGILPIAHSVLTTDLVDEAGHPTRVALDRVLAFFHERLD